MLVYATNTYFFGTSIFTLHPSLPPIQTRHHLLQPRLALRQNHQGIPRLQHRRAVRGDVLVVALDHGNVGVLREAQLHNLLPLSIAPRRNRQLPQRGLGQVDDELIGVGIGLHLLGNGHVQPAGHERERGALDQHGGDGDEENDVEDGVGFVDAGQQRVGGENDGDGAAEADPGDVETAAELHPEEHQAEEHAHGTGHENQEEGDEQADADERHHLGREDEQAEGEEEHDLHEPGQTVVHPHDGLFVDQVLVAEVDGADVDGEEAVAADGVGGGEGEKHQGDHEHGVQAFEVEPDAVDDEFAEATETEAGRCADAHLQQEQGQDGEQRLVLVHHQAQESDGEHVGHGVVAAAFELEGGSQVGFEGEALGAQDGEDGGGVGGADDGAEEHALVPAEVGDEVHEGADAQGGEEHPGGG